MFSPRNLCDLGADLPAWVDPPELIALNGMVGTRDPETNSKDMPLKMDGSEYDPASYWGVSAWVPAYFQGQTTCC